ncbi:Dehydrogenase, E1 component domain-containing protein [Penicillium ucsense]|uniref:2-oxoisovalerate dehydrogenase subunit alpha n=2 Tax=Penicillium TaxID=5073 RepID=A0A8J8W245_9EURO|nr:2-oxoisovalerate dehydrogenase subunit alpha [Penicillium diatomitis]KAF7716026.1 Dehydrogenase, E1 component domain-containing protein [Penicillium ucsense]KAF7732173.1 Dehydrogenase, E1 component domain-containing protein [Penicillium ucsense]KAJ5495887.1 2-oxoisovalerate dehydrogenase subunit alpha [Penicillium diatomitis]
MSSKAILQRSWRATCRSPRMGAPKPTYAPRRWSGSISQRPGSDRVLFPGAVNSKFTTDMSFLKASDLPAIPTYRVIDSDGELVDNSRAPPDVSDEEVLTWYKNMLSVSIMDVVMFEAQRQGRLSFYMVSAGEEGIAVASAAALTPDDVVFAQYREAGVFQQRGYTLKNFMGQLFANCNDTGKGRNMPVHYGQNYPRIHTISSPLATQIPHAAGAAYALKMQDLQNPNRERRIVACYFGEGAASEGDFHAALNIAATRSCPVVFVCRNNGFAISTPTLEQYRGDGIASRGVGYGIDTIRVDGNDVFAVNEAMKEARRLALTDGGRPVLIEAMSYRVSHHSTSDDSFAYRARVEVEDWKRRDNPIIRLRKWLENKGLWNDELEQETRDSMRKAVLKEFSEAEREKKPPLREAFADVYEELTEEAQAQMKELKRILETYPDEYDLRPYKDGVKGLD